MQKHFAYFLALILISWMAVFPIQAMKISDPPLGQAEELEIFLPFDTESNDLDTFEDFDEFKPFDEDGFESFSASCDAGLCDGCESGSTGSSGLPGSFWWTIGILGATILSGLIIRIKNPIFRTRIYNLRFFTLLASVVVLGFIKGGCPCMISSFENTVLLAAGIQLRWTSLLWFLGLIPISYLLGRVFCGWICHLGALQEFLYMPGKWSFLSSRKSVRVLKIMRYVLVAALVLQLLIGQNLFWCRIDPFLSIFQLMLAYQYEYLSVLLIALLLVSSMLSFRPFCRGACPVGLVLGWVEKIPGASTIGIRTGCKSCVQCSNACKIHALYRENQEIQIDNQECIFCGECLAACKKSEIGIDRTPLPHSKN